MRVISEARVRLFRESTNPKVVFGEGGLIFYGNEVNQRCFSSLEERFADSTRRAGVLMQYTGREFVVLIAPDKAAIYHESLPTESCALESAQAFLRVSNEMASVVFPYLELRSLAADSPPGDSPYYKWDTHWTTLGASTGSSGIVNAVAPSSWDEEALVASDTETKEGDLAILLGIRRREVEPLYESVRPGASTEESALPNLLGIDGEAIAQADGHRYETELDAGNLIEPRTLLLHDSFGRNLIRTLTPYFAHFDTFRYTEIDDASRPQILEAEVLVLEFVQRNWRDLTAPPFDEALAAILADELGQVPFDVDTDGGTLVVVARQPPECDGSYLIIERPTNTDTSVTVDGEDIDLRTQSLTAAYWSASGRWTIETSSADALASVRVVGVCPDAGA